MLTFARVPQVVLETLGFVPAFQNFPQDIANVNEWKIIFDPSITVRGSTLAAINAAIVCEK